MSSDVTLLTTMETDSRTLLAVPTKVPLISTQTTCKRSTTSTMKLLIPSTVEIHPLGWSWTRFDRLNFSDFHLPLEPPRHSHQLILPWICPLLLPRDLRHNLPPPNAWLKFGQDLIQLSRYKLSDVYLEHTQVWRHLHLAWSGILWA